VIELTGETIELKELQIPKAKELAEYLLSDVHPAARLLGVKREPATGAEAVLFEVRVELSQDRKFAILPNEKIAVSFSREDDILPEVISLREDFPVVPHLNQRHEELPRSLCLYDLSYEAIKLRWTAHTFIERVREWLSLTADGKLHQEDQPLEPLILGHFLPLILPATFFADIAEEPARRKRFSVTGIMAGDGTPTAYRLVGESGDRPRELSHVVTILITAPREHSIIRRIPLNLKDLISLCETSGLDLVTQLKSDVPTWKDDATLRSLRLLLVIVFQKQRASGTEITEPETLGFELQCTVEDLGARLGLWARSPNGSLGAVIGIQEDTTDQVTVAIVNPVLELTKAAAAIFNGIVRNDEQFVMVGVGALGSMLLSQLARKGFGEWTILDSDTMLPHNGARHLLPGEAAGFLKAPAVRSVVNVYYHENPVVTSLTRSSLRPGILKEEIDGAFRNAAAIIDCSADVPTARSLSLEAIGAGRRVSLFLSPNGEHLVMLAEDRPRISMLDALEMQYYRCLLHTPGLTPWPWCA
jgi:hypothetical protein